MNSEKVFYWTFWAWVAVAVSVASLLVAWLGHSPTGMYLGGAAGMVIVRVVLIPYHRSPMAKRLHRYTQRNKRQETP
jgi:hypothetical protein